MISLLRLILHFERLLPLLILPHTEKTGRKTLAHCAKDVNI